MAAPAPAGSMSGRTALIIGTGPGLSASLARRCSAEGMQVAVAARDTAKLADVCADSGARAYRCDATAQDEVEALFASVESDLGTPHFVVYNPGARAHGPITDIDPGDVERALMVGCFGGFLVGQTAAKRLLPMRDGAIFFTGATASVKGYPHSAAFAMGKFGLRGLAQSMARELAPAGDPRSPLRDRRSDSERLARADRHRGRRLPGPGRDRGHLLERLPPAPELLDLGGRGPALGRDVLSPAR